uniref:Uncharacterized protein n=1 Tax=Triticum urartu TaxID=4572 RepID=A0A8R7PLR2_TRIUA
MKSDLWVNNIANRFAREVKYMPRLEQVHCYCCSCVSKLLARLACIHMSRCLIFVTFLTYHCYF